MKAIFKLSFLILIPVGIYFGLFQQLDWAKNILLFVSWIFIIGDFAIFTDEVKKKLKETQLTISQKIVKLILMVSSIIMIANSWWITGSLLFTLELYELSLCKEANNETKKEVN